MSFPVTIRSIDQEDAAALTEWDRCVVSSPQGSGFFLSGWAVGLRHHLGRNCRMIGIFQQDRLVGGLVLSEFGRWGVRGARRPFATPFCHPFFHESLPDDAVRTAGQALHQYLLRSYHLFTLTSSYFNTAEHAMVDGAQGVTDKWTMLLDLRDLPSLWDRFQSELRNRIRKARKLGMVVQPAKDTSEFYRHYVELFADQGRRVSFSAGQFADFCQSLSRRDLGQVYEARDRSGDLHVAALITWDARRAYYTLSATQKALRHSGANALLLWEIFERLACRIQTFDMVGLNLPTITRFKRRFRGEEIRYPEYAYFAHSWVKLGWQAYKMIGSK